jgi:uncharacterized sporulation protein YeaH/YhbH (DUF444 family)
MDGCFDSIADALSSIKFNVYETRAPVNDRGFRELSSELRKLVAHRYVKPRRFVCDEYMKLGFDARIIIERPKRKAVRRRIVVKAAEKR